MKIVRIETYEDAFRLLDLGEDAQSDCSEMISFVKCSFCSVGRSRLKLTFHHKRSKFISLRSRRR